MGYNEMLKTGLLVVTGDLRRLASLFSIIDERIMALQGLGGMTANQRCSLKSHSGAIPVRSREKNTLKQLTNALRDKNESVQYQLVRIKSSV